MRKYLAGILVISSLPFCCSDDDKPNAYSHWQDYYNPPYEPTYILSMALDDEGNLWTTCFADTCSLRKFDDGRTSYFNTHNEIFLNHDFVKIYEDEERKMWSGHGVVISHHSGIRQNFQPPFRYWSVNSIMSTHISSKIQIDSKGNVWDANYLNIGYPYNESPVGLRMFNGEKWIEYNTSNSPLPTNHVTSLCFNLEGDLLVSSLPEAGQAGTVMKFDGQNWSTIYASAFKDHWISSMVVDNAGTLWMGELDRKMIGNEYGGGLFSLTGSTLVNYTIANSKISSNSVTELSIDGAQNLWIGTYNGGLIKFNRKDQWLTINSENSPMPWPNSVEHIRLDKAGNVWISIQQYGLAMVTP